MDTGNFRFEHKTITSAQEFVNDLEDCAGGPVESWRALVCWRKQILQDRTLVVIVINIQGTNLNVGGLIVPEHDADIVIDLLSTAHELQPVMDLCGHVGETDSGEPLLFRHDETIHPEIALQLAVEHAQRGIDIHERQAAAN